MKLGKAPRQARCYVTGNVIPTFLSACSDMGKRGRQLSAIKHWKQNQTLLNHSWNHLDLHNIKTECILIHHPAQSFFLLCFPWDQTDQHSQSWTSNKGQPWRSDWHESHTPWALTPLPPAPFPSQPQLGEFPQSRSHEGPVSARSTTQGLSGWWLSDTCPVPWRPCLAFCMFLPIAASMSQSLTSQKTTVRERPGFFPSRFLNCYRYRKWWSSVLVTLLLWRPSCLCSFESVFFSDLEKEPSELICRGKQPSDALSGSLLVFLLLNPARPLQDEGLPVVLTLFPPTLLTGQWFLLTVGLKLCLLLLPKAIQNSIYFNMYLVWPV